MLSYENVAAAIEWLVRAFGFAELAERFSAQIEVAGRVRIAVGGSGGQRISLLGIFLFEEKLSQIRKGPVVFGVLVFE